MELERKSYEAEVKAIDAQKGVIEAIVSVFTVPDRSGERVVPGAFDKSITRKLPKGVWMHDWKQPIAKTLEARELSPGDLQLPERLRAVGGLYIKGQFNLDTQRGKEAFSDLKFGLVDEFSIGYRVTTKQVNEETSVVDLIEMELYEWSPVLVGMHPDTALVSIKDLVHRGSLAGLEMNEHSDAVLAAVKGWSERLADIKADRAMAGRAFPGEERKSGISSMIAELESAIANLKDIVSEPEQFASVDEIEILAGMWELDEARRFGLA